MTLWTQDMGTVATKGQGRFPLRRGQAGHPCAHCGAISLYEWSPGRWRACSAICLLQQVGDHATINAAVQERHGASLLSMARREASSRSSPAPAPVGAAPAKAPGTVDPAPGAVRASMGPDHAE